jgi:N-acetylmuramoyl-L-alanine amidase
MSTEHTVAQGEHLVRIADQYGFADYGTIWNHADNAELKTKRENPNVLFPGDQITIPEKETSEYSRATDNTHKFRKSGKPLQLNLKLERAYDGAVSGTPCDLSAGALQVSLTTDGDGAIGSTIPKSVEDVRLVVHEKIEVKDGTLPADEELALQVGWLDPVDERSGQVGRLANLGYYRGPFDPVDEPELLSAVEEFQCEHDLKVDGICGPATQAKLKEVHGS